jgi:ABC-2 type transport system permease protein
MSASTSPVSFSRNDGAPTRPGLVSDSLQMVGRSMRHTVRGTETLLISVMLPVILLLLFVYVFGGALGGKDYVDYVVPGIIVLCAGFGASQTAVSVATDLSNGIIRRFRTMSIVSSAVLTGHVVASVARNVVATVLVFTVAFLAGFRPHASPGAWLAVAGLLLLFVIAISWLSAALGLLAGNPEAANGVTFAVMFLPYLSSAFVPIDTMPGVLQAISRHQPLTPVIDTLRALLLGTPVGDSAWLAVAWMVAIAGGSAAVCGWLFRRRTT